MKEQTRVAAESFTCSPSANPVDTTKSTVIGITEPTPIDGVFQVTTTLADLRAAGDPDPVPENYGAWTYVFDRGRFAFTQENEQACSWGYGTYEVKGSRIEWSFINGGGITPTGASNKPGEFFVFGWSIYRDLLTLTAVPGRVSPDNFLLKPWQLTSATPSRSALNAHCPPPAAALWSDSGAQNTETSTSGT